MFTHGTKVCGDVVVSTDSAQIADVAAKYGADVLQRDADLARDNTPIWPVLRAVLAEMEAKTGEQYDTVILLEVTSPFRRKEDLKCALDVLDADPGADGIMATARFLCNPIWNGFTVNEKGYLDYLVDIGRTVHQRQQVIDVHHHVGSFYIWQASFVREHADGWQSGKYLHYPTPAQMAFSIDTAEEFDWMQRLVKAGLVTLEWDRNGI
jgi:CMP-N-acetylneuraminic acid synthetase